MKSNVGLFNSRTKWLFNPFIIFYLVLLPVFNLQAEITRGPYLQSLSSSGIKIMWSTNDVTTTVIRIGKSVGVWEKTVANGIKVTRHIASISNLEPNTTYYYGVFENGKLAFGGNELCRFTTAPVPGSVIPIRIWALGDFGKSTEVQHQVKQAFAAYTKSHPANFWIWLGDNAYQRGREREFQDHVFSKYYGYDSLMKFLPFFPTPGNHDYGSVRRLGGPKKHKGPYYDIVEVPQKGECGGVPSGTELYYSYDYGNTHFISLNSEVWDYTIFWNKDMRKWLEADLETNKMHWTVVYFHEAPYSQGSHDSDDFWEIFMKAMRKKYVPILEKYGVDLVVCGHSHVYERSFFIHGHYGRAKAFEPDKMMVSKSIGNILEGDVPFVKFRNGKNANLGTVYVNCGVGGKPYPDPPFGYPAMAVEDNSAGSLIIDINGDELTGSFLKADGKLGDKFRIIKYTKTGQQKRKKVAESFWNKLQNIFG